METIKIKKLGKTKEWSRKYYRKNRKRLREYHRAYMLKYQHTPKMIEYRRNYYKTPEVIAKRNIYRSTPKFKAYHSAYMKKYNKIEKNRLRRNELAKKYRDRKKALAQQSLKGGKD